MPDLRAAARALLECLDGARIDGDSPHNPSFDSGWGVLEAMDNLRAAVEASTSGETKAVAWMCVECGAFWRKNADGSWNMASAQGCAGCDNGPAPLLDALYREPAKGSPVVWCLFDKDNAPSAYCDSQEEAESLLLTMNRERDPGYASGRPYRVVPLYAEPPAAGGERTDGVRLWLPRGCDDLSRAVFREPMPVYLPNWTEYIAYPSPRREGV